MTTEISKCYRHSTLFDTPNAGNRIFELLDFKFVWAVYPQIPLEKVTATYYTFRHLLHFQ